MTYREEKKFRRENCRYIEDKMARHGQSTRKKENDVEQMNDKNRLFCNDVFFLKKMLHFIASDVQAIFVKHITYEYNNSNNKVQ